MTANEITTLIASKVNKQFDEPYKLVILKKVDYYRVRFIRNALEKEQKDRKFFRQHFYMEMERKVKTPCANNCEFAITKGLVPTPIRVNQQLFDYLGAIDGANAFQEVQVGMLNYQGKYSKRFLKYIYDNRRIEVYGNPAIPVIRVDGIFENPTEVLEYICNSNKCNFWDLEYPITQDILQLVVGAIQEELVPIKNTEIPVVNESEKA